MHERFEKLVKNFPIQLTYLIESIPYKYEDLVKMTLPERGIYLFSQGQIHLYVGRTQKFIKKRIQAHVRKSVKDSPFAFKLAREKTELNKPDYKGHNTRKKLNMNEKFLNAYYKSKDEIKEMDIRFIEMNDPYEQALFEIYVHVVLNTKYNDFDTH